MSEITAKALYDFMTEEAGELCFNVNDVLVIINQMTGSNSGMIHPYTESAPPRTYGSSSAVNGLPRPSPALPIQRTVHVVSCDVHKPFDSPSPTSEHSVVSSGGAAAEVPALPDGRPVPPVKPPGLFARMEAVVQQTAVETTSDEDSMQDDVNLLLPCGRPVPPVKPPGLFARMLGTGHPAIAKTADNIDDHEDDDIDEVVCSNASANTPNDEDGIVEVRSPVISGVRKSTFAVEYSDQSDGYDDDEAVAVDGGLWDDDCDEYDDDFYTENLDNAHHKASSENIEDTNAEGIEADADVAMEATTSSEANARPTTLGTPKRQHSRLSHFATGGGDTYLFDMQLPGVPESVLRNFISESSDSSPCWISHMEPYTCSVLSPKRGSKFHGMKSFMVYQIRPSFSHEHVSRRYKQFDWLHRRLVDKFSTVAVPPLPEKQLAGRFEDEFVRHRLRQLQLWIDRMCRHPIIAQSEVFIHFITCTGTKEWKRGKRTAERDKYQGGLFFQTVIAPSKALNARYVERQMDNFGRFMRNMDDSVRHLYGVCEANTKSHQDVFGKEYHKLGRSIAALAKAFEYDERPVAVPLTKAVANVANTVDDIGTLFTKQPRHDLNQLMEGLNEYRGLLSIFPDILLVYRASTNKIQENAGMLSEADIEAVERRADVITYSVLAEMEHFQKQRVVDYRAYMQRYIKGQIEFYREITMQLQNALQQFDGV